MTRSFVNKRILITSGPTSVAIDDMRVITNRSTGEMGRLMANAFAKKGAKVTLLEGTVTTTVPLIKGIKVLKFFLFDELDQLLTAQLKKQPDVVIHAAAVSDFRPVRKFKGKVCSGDKLMLELAPTRKLINGIRKQVPGAIIVGFKLESSLRQAMGGARDLLKKADCDLVVANAYRNEKYQASLVSLGGASKVVNSKPLLVKTIVDLLCLVPCEM